MRLPARGIIGVAGVAAAIYLAACFDGGGYSGAGRMLLPPGAIDEGGDGGPADDGGLPDEGPGSNGDSYGPTSGR